jgi:hypothetical protein
MKINPKDIKVPFIKKMEYKKGEVEVSLSKRSDEACLAYQEFVADYLSLNESTASREEAIKEACDQYEKHEAVISEAAAFSDNGELSPAQKKLPPAIQKVILKNKKAGKGGKDDKEEKDESKAKAKDMKEKPEPGETEEEEKAESPEMEKKEKAAAKLSKNQPQDEDQDDLASKKAKDNQDNQNGEKTNTCKDPSCATHKSKAKSAKDVEDEEEQVQKKNDSENTKASSQPTRNLTKDDKKPQKPLDQEMKK